MKGGTEHQPSQVQGMAGKRKRANAKENWPVNWPDTFYQLIRRASVDLPTDVETALRAARRREERAAWAHPWQTSPVWDPLGPGRAKQISKPPGRPVTSASSSWCASSPEIIYPRDLCVNCSILRCSGANCLIENVTEAKNEIRLKSIR